MSILVQDLIDRLEFALDAEGADHYDNDRDYIPAINAAVNWLISVINSTLGHKKLGEEIFRELKRTEVHFASVDSRISLRHLNNELWTITAVYVKPTTGTTGAAPQSPAQNQAESERRDDLYHRESQFSAKRLTIEEWATNKNNPFEAGYDLEVLCDGVTQYAYLDPHRYDQADGTATESEIEVRPSVANENVTVFYVKKPTAVTAVGDTIEFPDSVFSLIFNKALQYIAYKQGDGTNAFGVSSQDIALLIRTVN
jgi:hypothetical protein